MFPSCEGLDRLRGLRVSDVMSREVISIPHHATLCEAAGMLTSAGTSGAPVVDEAGRCIGMISSRDYLRQHAASCQLASAPGSACASDDMTPIRHFMAPAVQSIDSGASLMQAARVMCLEHIHRLVVLDERATPVGVLTTLDIVAALMAVADEERQALRRNANGRQAKGVL